MNKVFLFLATGFEETEAIVVIDILRRGGLEVQVVSVADDIAVTGAHGITVEADVLFDKADFSSGKMLVLPGGMPGAAHLNEHAGLRNLLSTYYQSGKKIAAICAAPLVLGGLGILKGKKATCYPGYESYLTGAVVTGNPVEVAETVVTGIGPGFVCEFGLTLLGELAGKAQADEVAKQFLLK